MIYRFVFLLVYFISCHTILQSQDIEQDSASLWDAIYETEPIEFSEPEKALRRYQNIFEQCVNKKFINPAFKAALFKGCVYNNIAEYDSALLIFNEAENVNKQIGSKLNESLLALNRANTYMFMQNFDASIKNHFRGIAILEERSDSSRLCDAYANLSSVYQNLDDLDKQIEFLEKSLKMVTTSDSVKLGLTHCDLVGPNLMLEKFDKALMHCKTCDSISTKLDNEMLSFFSTRSWGEYHLFRDEYQLASRYCKDALEMAEKYNYNYYIADLKISLGDALLNSNQFDEAKEYIESSLDFGKTQGLLELEKKASFMLAILMQKTGNHKSAMTYMIEHDNLKDSLVNIENKKLLADANARFLSEKKDKEIAQNLFALEKSRTKSKMLTFGIMALLASSIFLWFLFRQRQNHIQQQLITIQKEQELRSLEALIAGEEKERLRVAQELHDGVNGDLAAIKFKLSSMLQMNNKVIQEAVTMIDTSCQKVRAISHNLIPPSLQNFNLIEAVQSFAEKTNNIHDENVSFNFIGDELNMSKKIEINILRIIQELVSNAIKHAEADNIDIQISHRNNTIEVTVEDDGIGYQPGESESEGIGLSNIRSRVEFLNATYSVQSDQEGTSNIIEMDTRVDMP